MDPCGALVDCCLHSRWIKACPKDTLVLCNLMNFRNFTNPKLLIIMEILKHRLVDGGVQHLVCRKNSRKLSGSDMIVVHYTAGTSVVKRGTGMPGRPKSGD